MRMVVVAFLALGVVACDGGDPELACTAENHCDDSSGEPQCEPRFTWEDPDDPDNYRCVPIDRYDPCDPNPCTTPGRTTCTVSGGTRYCECDEGWHLDGFDCVEDDACTGVTCSGRGTCELDDDDEATCACERYYVADGLACVYAEALDELPVTCGRSGAPALVVEEIAPLGAGATPPIAGQPPEPAIAVTSSGEAWVAYPGADAVSHLRVASKGPSDVDWQDGPAFETDFQGFSAALTVGGGRLFLAATGRNGDGEIDRVKAAVRTTGIWERFDLDQATATGAAFGRLDISANGLGNAAVAVRRRSPSAGGNEAWLSDTYTYFGTDFAQNGETSFLCSADAGVALSEADDLWSVCLRLAIGDEPRDSLRLSRYGGSLWTHEALDGLAAGEPWQRFLDAEIDERGRVHVLYEGLDTSGDPETAYALYEPVGQSLYHSRLPIRFASESADLTDGGATLVLDDEGCPIIVGRLRGSQGLTYAAPRNDAEWAIEGLGEESATRVAAHWRNDALHLVTVEPTTSMVTYVRATWP